jgi:hypothetical protein
MTSNEFDRRQWLARAGLLTAFGALWSPTAANAQNDDRGRTPNLEFDVACLGHTFRPIFPGPPYAPVQATPPPDLPGVGGPDSRGAVFIVEGLVYPAGTIPAGNGFDPASVPAQGHWLCRGWFISYLDRVLPHVVTTQEYLCGLITPAQPSPADTLVSSGVEGAIAVANRAVIGGTGRLRHARGDIRQVVIGLNTTVLLPPEVTGGAPFLAPNFRFYCDLA